MFAKLFPNLAKSNVDPKEIQFKFIATKLDLQVWAQNFGQSVFIPFDEKLRGELPDPEAVKEWIRKLKEPAEPTPAPKAANKPKTSDKQPAK